MSRFTTMVGLALLPLLFFPTEARAGRTIMWVVERYGLDPEVLPEVLTTPLWSWILSLLEL